jgi:hypothetical protein
MKETTATITTTDQKDEQAHFLEEGDATNDDVITIFCFVYNSSHFLVHQ